MPKKLVTKREPPRIKPVKPKPKSHSPHRKSANHARKAAPKEIKAMMENKQETKPETKPETTKQPFPPGTEPPVTQTSSTEAGFSVDPAAQKAVQDALNLRVAHDAKVPFVSPEVPPGLSPNEILALASSGSIQIPPQTDKPPTKSDGKSKTEEKDKSKEETHKAA